MLTTPPTTPTDEILDFLLSAPTPEDILALRPSDHAQQRLAELLDKNQNGRLTDAEQAELDIYMQTEHFVRRLKIRAHEILANQKP